MKKITWSHLLIPLLVMIIIGGAIERSHRRAELSSWIQTAAQRDDLTQLAIGRYKRAVVELERVRDIRAALRDSFPELHSELRRIRAREMAYISTIANLQEVVAMGAAVDTVIITVSGDSIHQVAFEYSQPGIRIDGWTRTPPPIYQLRVRHDPIPMSLVISQLRDRSWQVNVETAPWIEISSLNTSVIPQRLTLWQKNRHWIFLGVGTMLGRWMEK